MALFKSKERLVDRSSDLLALPVPSGVVGQSGPQALGYADVVDDEAAGLVAERRGWSASVGCQVKHQRHQRRLSWPCIFIRRKSAPTTVGPASAAPPPGHGDLLFTPRSFWRHPGGVGQGQVHASNVELWGNLSALGADLQNEPTALCWLTGRRGKSMATSANHQDRKYLRLADVSQVTSSSDPETRSLLDSYQHESIVGRGVHALPTLRGDIILSP